MGTISRNKYRHSGGYLSGACSLLAAILVTVPFIFAVPGVHWDDAYIFFRYADNLAAGQGLAFNAGEPSVGVTSILWTVVLALLRLTVGPTLPFASKLLGALLSCITAGLWGLMVARWTRREWVGTASGVMLAASPVGVLLAVSGMDTALSVLLFSLVVFFYSDYQLQYPVRLGVLSGILFLARPDGLGLVAIMVVLSSESVWNSSWKVSAERSSLIDCARRLTLMLGSAALVGVPWVILVYRYTGHLIPPTRIGKLIERLPHTHGISYPQFQELDVLSRLELAWENTVALFSPDRGGVTILPFFLALIIGAPIVAIVKPGWCGAQRGARILALLWAHTLLTVATYSLLFPLPLPRYVASIIPTSIAGTFLLIGSLVPFLEALGDRLVPKRVHRLTTAGACLFLVVATIGPLVVTYRAYVPHAVNQQMRQSIGVWIRDNTPPTATIALESIGEIGFYSERRIVDLGGLISSEVWEYVMDGYDDADRMFEFLRRQRVDYLIDRPPEIPWSLSSTVQKYPDHFTLRTGFGSGIRTHLIYELSDWRRMAPGS